MVTVLCQEQYAEIGLDASKIIILMSKIWLTEKFLSWRIRGINS